MKKTVTVLLVVGVILGAARPGYSAGAGITLLHEFTAEFAGMRWTYDSLILNSGKLYGMSNYGGDSGYGTVFSINTNGSNFALLHEFAGGGDDGEWPRASLTLDSGKLYGMTYYGGDSNVGIVFSMNTNGSGFSLLHEFAGGIDDGKCPRSSLIVDSGKLYGGTSGGGDVSGGVDGTIFSMDSTGTNFTLLHKFAAESGDGRLPVGYLILDSGKLYGMTGLGGDSNDGTVFSMNTNGSGFALLHEFGGGSDDGIGPQGGLVLDSGKLYGMTEMGGDSNDGTIFSIDTDGGNFTLLHEFAGESDDGALPAGRLVLEAGKLYGTTNKGGDSDLGTVFSMNTDGGNFTLLHDFTGGSDDGDNPHGSLIWDSGKLYGMTDLGGDSNVGTIFVLPDHLPGDVNGNGYVDGTDLTIIISHWGQSGLGREFGDLNDNGVVDGPDYAEVLSYWNPPPEPPSEAVPEPATLGLMLIGGLVLLRRRR